MDEMDHIQEAEAAAAEARLAERLRRMEIEASIVPPESRECDECGCDIPSARLRIRPMTRLCVDCQNDAEAGHG